MIYHFYDTILYCDYYLKYVKKFRRHGLERSWKWKIRKTARRIAEKLKKLPKILLKPYNAYKAIDSFIDLTSRGFAIEVSGRFNGLKARIVYRLSYGFMWTLLRFAITSVFSVPATFIIAYIYISYLALAYNVYATQLFTLPMEVIA